MRKVTIYTDGACSYNPGPGGWGAVLMCGDYKKELSGGTSLTTNNRMELLAVIESLRALKEPCDIDLYSDSAYVINAFNEGWTESWKRNNWRKSDKKPVLNADLWKSLLEIVSIHNVKFIKVKGHSDNLFNNRCDELARLEVTKLSGEEKSKS